MLDTLKPPGVPDEACQRLAADAYGLAGQWSRIEGERELTHGDYLFLGKQLLRVEMTA